MKEDEGEEREVRNKLVLVKRQRKLNEIKNKFEELEILTRDKMNFLSSVPYSSDFCQKIKSIHERKESIVIERKEIERPDESIPDMSAKLTKQPQTRSSMFEEYFKKIVAEPMPPVTRPKINRLNNFNKLMESRRLTGNFKNSIITDRPVVARERPGLVQ